MFYNYLIIAIRNLLKHKIYSLINVSGLAVGLASCMLLAIYIHNELNYDKYHQKADRIYQVLREDYANQGSTIQPGTSGPLGTVLSTDFPEIEKTVRLMNKGYLTTWAWFKDKGFLQQFCVADPTLFTVFDFSFLKGNPETALNHPNSVVLTETAAQQYFGNTNPLDQTLKIEGYWAGDYTITGIIKDIPIHSTLKFNMVASPPPNSRAPILSERWSTGNGSWRPVETYVLLREGESPTRLKQKFPDLIQQYMGKETAARVTYHVQPLIKNYKEVDSIYLFSAVAIFILLIACINFVNLTTARSINRLKEVGLRKVVGAHRIQLIKQFLGESLLLTFFGSVLSICLVFLILPSLSQFIEKPLLLSQDIAWKVGLSIIGIMALVGLLSGFYPAFFLSAFQPAHALKGSLNENAKGGWLRKGLVIFQFAILAGLIIGTGAVYQQWQYMGNRQWGFNKDQVVILPIINNDSAQMYSENWLGYKRRALKRTFLNHPNILAASISHIAPPYSVAGKMRTDDMVDPINIQYITADDDFLDTFEIELITGQNFSPTTQGQFGSPKDFVWEILLNQTAVKQLGLKDPIGTELDWVSKNRRTRVIGVVKDFQNHEDLKLKIDPMVIVWHGQPSMLLSLRIHPANLSETMAFLEKTWKEFLPTRPFNYSFLNDQLEKLYRQEERLGQVIGTFSLIGIVVACMGLFGLASFTAEQRVKEIGVRKVLGASIANVVMLLSKDFLKLVALANLIAWPITYYIMENWLSNFAYRIELQTNVFMISATLTIVIALTTVGYQAFKAAIANPVDALRNE